jgi:nucleoside diphosphate kinase
VRRHLVAEAVALWRDLGVRIADVDNMTLDDALIAEVYAEDERRRRAREDARRRRSR